MKYGRFALVPKYVKYDKNADFAYSCGVFPSIELMKNRPEEVIALLLSSNYEQNAGAAELERLCEERGIYVETAQKAIERISGKENCAAVAVFKKYENALCIEKPHVVLHNISDSGNFGTISRTALGFGINDMALISPCVDIFSPKSVRASMGAIFSQNIRVYESFAAYESEFYSHKKFFFRLKNAQPLNDVDGIVSRSSLVFGNEASGLPDELCERETGVFIPHSGAIDSLNLAVAAGIGIENFARKMGLLSEVSI